MLGAATSCAGDAPLDRLAVIGAVALTLAGCGGSSSPRYSGGALEACLKKAGESIVPFASMPRSERIPLAVHLPGGFAVRFLSGEFGLFYVAANAKTAVSARAWLIETRAANRASSSSSEMSVSGNLLELIEPDPTLGTQTGLDQCRAAART
jgi:hypothetical protein